MRTVSVIFLAGILLLTAGCGSRQAAPSSTSLHPAAVSPVMLAALERNLPSLPPADHFTPQRAAAAAVTRNGADFHAADNVSVDSGAALLSAPAGQPAWALYQFNSLPGEALGDLSFTGSFISSEATLWVALADYSTGRWSFIGGLEEASGSIPLAARSADLRSPGGSIYALFLVHDTAAVQLDTVSLDFPGRFAVSGTVVDRAGDPIEGVTISTPVFGYSTQTGPDGSFTLPELPAGNWPLLAAKHGWTFFDVPHFISVDNAPISGIELLGQYSASNFTPSSEPVWNNSADRATAVDFSSPLLASLSIIDDPEDYFAFTVSDPGDYYFQLSAPGQALLFPLLELLDADGNLIENSYYCLRGDICLGFTVADPDTSYLLRVSLSGAGGDYSVSLNSGSLNSLTGRLMIIVETREAGLEATLIRATTDSGIETEYITDNSGYFNDAFRLPEMTQIQPQALNYSFTPTIANADLSAGDVTVPTFAYVQPTVSNSHYEPNNDLPSADANAVLSLPYDSLAEGDSLALLAENDVLDFFRLNPTNGHSIVARMYLEGNAAVRDKFFMYISKGASIILGEAVPTSYGYEVRMEVPYSGGEIYLAIGLLSNGVHRHPYRLEVEEYFPTMVYFDIKRNGRPLPNVRVELRDSAYDWLRSVSSSVNGTTTGIPLPAGDEMFVELFRYGLMADRSTFRLIVPPPGSGKIDLDLTTAFDADSNEADDNRSLLDNIALPAQFEGTLEPGVDDNDHYKFTQPVAGQLRLLVSIDDPAVTLTASMLNQAGTALDIQPLTDGAEVLLDSAGPGNRYLQLSAGSFRAGYSISAEFIPAP